MSLWLERPTAVRSYWISGFFFPQGFCTAILQNYSRKHRVPINILNFAFEVVHGEVGEVGAVPEGVLVHGLYMQGMRWKWNEPPEMSEGSDGEATASCEATS